MLHSQYRIIFNDPHFSNVIQLAELANFVTLSNFLSAKQESLKQLLKPNAGKILFIVWLSIQCLLFYQYGVVTEFEAHKYISEANTFIKTSNFSTPNFWLYSVQIFIIAAAIKLKTGFLSVALVQLLFNGFATYSFYKLISAISNKLVGFIITLLLICNYPFQTFNTSLQTESLFFSLTILFSCYLLQIKKLNLKNFIKIFLFIVIISFTRPSGLLLIPGTFIYLFFRFFSSFSILSKAIVILVVITGFLFSLNIVLGSGGELDFMLPYRNECIICGVPTVLHLRDIRTSDNPNSIPGILYYITHNSQQFVRLAWLRSEAFWGLFRSYFSIGHNFYLGMYFFPIYGLVIFSLHSWFKKNKALLFYCISFVLVTWGTVILTCDDWHNRFFLNTVPYLYILATPALQNILSKIFRNKLKKDYIEN